MTRKEYRKIMWNKMWYKKWILGYFRIFTCRLDYLSKSGWEKHPVIKFIKRIK